VVTGYFLLGQALLGSLYGNVFLGTPGGKTAATHVG